MAMKNVKKVVALLMAASVMSISSVSFALDNSFNQDFESYDIPTFEYGTFKTGATDTSTRHFIKNADTLKTQGVANNTYFFFQGDFNINPDVIEGMNTTSGLGWDQKWSDVSTLKKENARTLGLDGWIGLTDRIMTAPQAMQHKGVGKGDDSLPPMVVQNHTTKSLYMYTQSDANGLKTNWFGKDKLNIYGTKKKISVDFNAWASGGYTNNSTRIALVLTKGYGDLVTKVRNTQENYHNVSMHATGLKSESAAASDMVTITNKKAYLGLVSDENFICDLDYTNGHRYTIDVYLDYQTNTSAPSMVVVITDKVTGEVVGRKAGLLPVVAENNDVEGATSATYMTPAFGDHNHANFTPDDATDGLGHAVFVDISGNARMFIDNFSMQDDVVYTALAEISGTISGNAVNATVTPGSTAATNAKLFAAEFDAETGRCLQIAPAQDVSYAALGAAQTPTVTFSNALTEGSNVKLYLWDSFTNIHPLANAVTVK